MMICCVFDGFARSLGIHRGQGDMAVMSILQLGELIRDYAGSAHAVGPMSPLLKAISP
jgi:hypothetical protein